MAHLTLHIETHSVTLLCSLIGKESACHVGDPGLIPGLRRVPLRREWLPTKVFLSGEFHGQRSLVGYSPCGHKESNMTEWLILLVLCTFLPHLYCYHMHLRIWKFNCGELHLCIVSSTLKNNLRQTITQS